MAVLILWYTFVAPAKRTMDPGPGTRDQQLGEKKTSGQRPETRDPKKKISEPGKEVILENNLVKITLGSQGGIVHGWELKRYSKINGAVSLAEKEGTVLDIAFQGTSAFPSPIPFQIVEQTPLSAKLRWDSKGLSLTKTFRLALEGYAMDVEVELAKQKKETLVFVPTVEWGKKASEESPQRGISLFKSPPDRWQPVYFKEGNLVVVQPEKVPLNEVQVGNVGWVGAQSRYFLGGVLGLGKEGERLTTGKYPLENGEAGSAEAGQPAEVLFERISYPESQVLPGDHWIKKFKVFGGPKDLKALKEMGGGFEKAIGYGWSSVVAIPMLYLLKMFYSLVRNYGLSIILLTMLIKILLNPINRKSLKSMKEMQAVQPKLKELREKYGNDKERLNVEMMNLFKAHKINPMGGCLPMVVQIPIYIALYKVLWSSVELYHAPFFWFYKDLSAPDPYLITPLLLGITMFIQTKMTPTPTADPAQQKMMLFMPILFCGFMIFLPMGLGLYIFVNTTMTILQQWMYRKDIRMRDLLLAWR